MKVIRGVSKEGNVICIIQICEMNIAQREADCGSNTFHDPIDCTTEQSGCKNSAMSDTWGGGEAGWKGRADPNTRCGAVMQVLY